MQARASRQLCYQCGICSATSQLPEGCHAEKYTAGVHVPLRTCPPHQRCSSSRGCTLESCCIVSSNPPPTRLGHYPAYSLTSAWCWGRVHTPPLQQSGSTKGPAVGAVGFTFLQGRLLRALGYPHHAEAQLQPTSKVADHVSARRCSPVPESQQVSQLVHSPAAGLPAAQPGWAFKVLLYTHLAPSRCFHTPTWHGLWEPWEGLPLRHP